VFQQPDRITFLYSDDHEVRFVRMNVASGEPDAILVRGFHRPLRRRHAGDRYGGDQDRAVCHGRRVRYAAHTGASRSGTLSPGRLRSSESSEERAAKENLSLPVGDTGLARDSDYKGKGLQLEFTVEDDGVFTTPWKATVTYRRPSGPLGQWPEYVCADNPNAYDPRDRGKQAAVPTADEPDF
jgi:hypothetical protein